MMDKNIEKMSLDDLFSYFEKLLKHKEKQKKSESNEKESVRYLKHNRK